VAGSALGHGRGVARRVGAPACHEAGASTGRARDARWGAVARAGVRALRRGDTARARFARPVAAVLFGSLPAAGHIPPRKGASSCVVVPFCLILAGVRLGCPFGVRGCSSGCSFGCTSIRRTPQTDTLLPARGRDLALRLALRKGVPASPLRSYPGTPFLDPPHHRCFGGARRRAWEGSERAAGWKWRTTTRRAGRHRSMEVGGGGRTWWVVGAGVFGGRLRGRLRRRRDGITWGMGGWWAGAGVGAAGARRAGKSAVIGVGQRLIGSVGALRVAGVSLFAGESQPRRRAGMGVAGRSPAVKQVQVPACGGALPSLANLLDSSSTTCKGRTQLGRCPTGSKEPKPFGGSLDLPLIDT
jgi:hypothetical protein